MNNLKDILNIKKQYSKNKDVYLKYNGDFLNDFYELLPFDVDDDSYYDCFFGFSLHFFKTELIKNVLIQIFFRFKLFSGKFENFNYNNIDFTEEQLSKINKKIENFDIKNIEFYKFDAYALYLTFYYLLTNFEEFVINFKYFIYKKYKEKYSNDVNKYNENFDKNKFNKFTNKYAIKILKKVKNSYSLFVNINAFDGKKPLFIYYFYNVLLTFMYYLYLKQTILNNNIKNEEELKKYLNIDCIKFNKIDNFFINDYKIDEEDIYVLINILKDLITYYNPEYYVNNIIKYFFDKNN